MISYEKDGKVTVKFADSDELKKMERENWLAVSTSVLRNARRDPGQFSPSIKVLRGGGMLEIPDGSVPLPDNVTFPTGTPLQLEYHHSKWHNVFVIKDNGGTIELRYEGWESKWDTDSEVTLKSSASKIITMPIEKLGKPDQELLSKIAKEAPNPFETFSK